MSPSNLPGPLSAQRLLALQLELECIAIDSERRLRRIPCANPDDIPRLLVIGDGTRCWSYLRADLPSDLRHALDRVAAEQAFRDPSTVVPILGGDPPRPFLTYTTRAPLAADQYPAAVRLPELNEIGRAVFGILIDDRLVSACASVRENDHCAEAWVWTEPDVQRRGYARQVTAAWIHDLQQQGKVPLYSHALENHASAGVARSLGLHHMFTALGYD